MENQVFIYGRDTSTGLIQPLNISGQGLNTILNTTGNIEWDDVTNKPAFSNVALSGLYTDLISKPAFSNVALSGLYTDLISKPALSNVATSGLYTDLISKPALSNVATSGLYADLTGKPVLAPVATTGSYINLSQKPVLSNVATSGLYADLLSKPSIPSTLDDLTDVAISAPLSGHIIIYNQTSSQFENRKPLVSDSSDVLFSGLANNDVITYSSSLSKWINISPAPSHFLSLVFPLHGSTSNAVGTSLSIEVLASSTLTYTHTYGVVTGTNFNKFVVNGLTNGVYKFSATITYNAYESTSSADNTFDIYLCRNNSDADVIACSSDSVYAQYAQGSASLDVICDFRSAVPGVVYFRFANDSSHDQFYRGRGNILSVQRIL